VVSQFIDTTVFMFIAFYMATPTYTVDFIFALIIPYYLLKIFVAVCDTPFVYLGVWWLKGEKPKKK
ncbi:MAG: VUT family protein, partial [Candidatus Aenigmarchaeota archaeon]|nr:VUT family protein [Candidatus Aenigmarchaeota archaeon]